MSVLFADGLDGGLEGADHLLKLALLLFVQPFSGGRIGPAERPATSTPCLPHWMTFPPVSSPRITGFIVGMIRRPLAKSPFTAQV
ncbi:hypothetical protein [Paracoccus sp. PAR01]|uniref:hypothetical protein n=1 Tax=Paracoccus sp. PAR01 TaxID=2769282 RepID=UPI00177E4CF3